MAFRLAYLRLTLTQYKGQSQDNAHWRVNISEIVIDRVKITIVMKSHLTLTHSQGQDQVRTHFRL